LARKTRNHNKYDIHISKPFNLIKLAVKVWDEMYFLDLLFKYGVNKPPNGITAKKTKVATAMKKPTTETAYADLEYKTNLVTLKA
jgi:hypothetical protein